MNKQALIKIARNQLEQGLGKINLREMPLFSRLPIDEFEFVFKEARKPLLNEKERQKRNKIKVFDKFISFRISLECYNNFERYFHQQIGLTANRNNKSIMFRRLMEEIIKQKLLEEGLKWENA